MTHVDIRDYLRVLRTGWAWLLVGLLLGAGAGVGASELATPRWTVDAQLFVTTTGSDDLVSAVQGSYYTEGKVSSYAELLRSKQLATAVLEAGDLGLGRDELISRISVEVVPDTTILDFSVTDESPTRALRIAEAVAGQFRAMVRELETPEGENTSPVRVTLTGPPELPSSPSSPARTANLALGAVVGLLLAGALTVLRDRLDTTVKDDAAAGALTGAPVIGQLPAAAELSGAHPPAARSSAPAVEAVRQVRTNLAFLDVDRPPRTILVTSSVAGEGKTTVSVNLALALAEAGQRVTLVEADLRRPRASRYLGALEGVGLTTVLTGAADLDEVLQPVGDNGLVLLGGGALPPNPGELLSSEAMAALVAELVATSDVVLIDAPPLLPVADATALAGLADGVLLCARWGKVQTDELQRSAAQLGRIGARLLGVVMTQVPQRLAPSAYGYGPEPARRRGLLRRRRVAATTADTQIARVPRRPISPPATGSSTGDLAGVRRS